ncbi:hypothetical protein BsWGS_16957 [Bradybaena similaris]
MKTFTCDDWISLAAEERSEGDPQADEYFRSTYVFGLDETNFKPFLKSKDMVLVMFYEPNCPDCEFSRMHFKKAAETTKRHNHAYAAVNCNNSPDLCWEEGSFNVPHFKLYSRGRVVGFVDNPRLFIGKDMKSWVEYVDLAD